jgi:mono/diheme cytochrome c family protein
MSDGALRAAAMSAIGATLTFMAASAWCATPPAKPMPAQVQRGAYLVGFGGCHDCHTPKTMTPKGPAPDMARALSGHPAGTATPPVPPGVLSPGQWIAMTNVHLTAWAGPWGVSYAANLTPDKRTGMGNWTADQFIRSMRTGKHLGAGRDILPPMPWQGIATLTDSDLRAVFAYLQSVKPIDNAVPPPVPPASPPPAPGTPQK